MTASRVPTVSLLCVCLAACQPIVDRAADNIAATVSERVVADVAATVSERVAIEIGTALAHQTIKASATTPPATESSEFSCTPSKTCSRMETCEEALYHLTVCGNKRLDGDGDGIPCQSLCGGRADLFPEEATPLPAVDEGEIGVVTRIIDGDTIDVRIDGKVVRIRYLQMNTPERDQPCFKESTDANAALVAGKTVRLVADKELVDPYDRWLRHVYVGEMNVNRVLVAEGFAEAVYYSPNDMFLENFQALEREAARAGRGCHPTGIFDDGSPTR